MRDGMTRLRTFTSELEGRIALGRLTDLGITALLQTDNCDGMHPHLDLLAGVHLLVADADLDKARDILAESGADPAGPAWTCPACGEESEAGFDACWNCGRSRD
jgi:hypothetical protein